MIGLVRDTVTIDTSQGRLTMSTKDTALAAALFRNREYEHGSSLRAVALLKERGFVPGDAPCMLDVGANIGVISVGMVLAGAVQGAIAVEPEPGNFRLLERNVRQNGLSDRVICLRLAAGETATTLHMELSPRNLGDHRVRSAATSAGPELYGESERRVIEPPGLPLSRILELPEVRGAGVSSPSFMWIDVQGHEGHVFKGAGELAAAGLPTISEVWPYGIRRSGMELEEFCDVVGEIWTDYWVERRERFTRYPITVFDRYLPELGSAHHYENVIFTRR